LTVTVIDTIDQVAVGYGGTIYFSSSDVQAGLPASYTFTPGLAGGVHTFIATLSTITNFEVLNAAAAKFVLHVPSNITAGTPFTLKVSVLDAFGNRVKNYFGTIHFANTAGIAGLPADYTFDSIDAGDHSFSVTLNTTGNQTLSVLDVVNPLLTASANFSVKAPATGGGGGGGKKV
jgi:hypothetical protein